MMDPDGSVTRGFADRILLSTGGNSLEILEIEKKITWKKQRKSTVPEVKLITKERVRKLQPGKH